MKTVFLIVILALLALPALAQETSASFISLADLPAIQAHQVTVVAQTTTDNGGSTLIDYVVGIVGKMDTPMITYNCETKQFALALAGNYKLASPKPWVDINVTALARSEDGIRFGAGLGATFKRIADKVNIAAGVGINGEWILGVAFITK